MTKRNLYHSKYSTPNPYSLDVDLIDSMLSIEPTQPFDDSSISDDDWILVCSKKKRKRPRSENKKEHRLVASCVDLFEDLNLDANDFIPLEPSARIYTIMETYPSDTHVMRVEDCRYYIYKKSTAKLIRELLPSDVFWSTSSFLSDQPRVETMEFLGSIFNVLPCGIKLYRGYSIYIRTSVKPSGFKRSTVKSKSGTEDGNLQLTWSDCITAAINHDGSFPDFARNVIQAISHIGAIFTATTDTNRFFCITAAVTSMCNSDVVWNFLVSQENPSTVLSCGLTETLSSASLSLQSPLGDHLDNLIAVFVMLGCLDEEKVTMQGIKLFATQFPKHTTARDIASRVLDALAFFSQSCYEMFKQRSFMPLFNLRDDLVSFSENVSEVSDKLQSVLQGNYQSVFLEDESKYEDLIVKTLAQSKSIMDYHVNAPNAEKAYIRQLQTKLAYAQSTMLVNSLARGTRVRPICIKFFGGSGVGKSYINQSTIIEVLKYNGFPSEPYNICTVEDEKFDSTIKSNSTGIIMDDLCNTRAEKEDNNVSIKLIRYVNNVCSLAKKADVQDKGKVLIMPKVVGITTNVRDLDSAYWSNEPESVMRRCDIHVDVYLRPEYTDSEGLLNSSKVLSDFSNETIHDIYLLRVLHYSKVDRCLKVFKYEDYSGAFPELSGRKMDGISYPAFLAWLLPFTKTFYADQQGVKDAMSAIGKRPKCKFCDSPMGCCEHTRTALPSYSTIPAYNASKAVAPGSLANFGRRSTVNSNSLLTCAATSAISSLTTPFTSFINKSFNTVLNNTLEHFNPNQVDSWLYKKYSKVDPWDWLLDYHEKWYAWNNLLPKEFMDVIRSSFIGQQLIRWSIHRSAYRRVKVTCAISTTGLVILGFWVPRKHMFTYVKCSVPLLASIGALSSAFTHEYLRSKLCDSKDFGPSDVSSCATYFKEQVSKKKDATKIFKFAISVATGVALTVGVVKAYRSWNAGSAMVFSQGNLNPNTDEDIKVRNTEKSLYTYFFPPKLVSCRTTDNFVNTISKNCRHLMVRQIGSEKSQVCSAIWLRTDELMLPKHMLSTTGEVSGVMYTEFEFKLTKAKLVGDDGQSAHGSTFVKWKRAQYSDVIDFGAMDWVILKTRGISGKINDLTVKDESGKGYFCPTSTRNERKLVTCIRRIRDGTVERFDTSINEYKNKSMIIGGQSYNPFIADIHDPNVSWKDGDCGTVLIDRQTKDPQIIGFFLYTDCGDLTQAYSILVSQEDIDKYKKSHSEVISCSMSGIPEVIYGYATPSIPVCPKHSPINFVQGNYDVLGHYSGNDHYKTNLVPTKIQGIVEVQYGIKFAPPDFKKSRPWDAFLEGVTTGNDYMDEALLDKCVDDYVAPLIAKSVDFPELAKDVKPLTNSQILNGVKGKRFMDRMKGTSAMGYPFSGKRCKYLTRIDHDPDYPLDDFSDKGIWLEFEKMHDQLARGFPLSHPYKSSLKDELREDGKMPRVFQCAPAFCQFFLRKYFLPIAYYISMFPILSECAIGINCASEEWDQLCTHVEKFGSDRTFAGDYSKYDQQFEKENMHAVMQVFIKLAIHFGYSDRDVKIMRTLAVDLMNPVYALFGSYVRVAKSNSSGNSITGYINSIGNSLKVRYNAYKLEGSVFNFRERVSLIVYGDDMKAGVRKDCKLNFRSYKGMLESVGTKFTLPSKIEQEVYPEFTEEGTYDFLKRKSVYIPELGYRVGALDIKSISKSFLYYNKKSSATEDSIMESTLISNSFEFACHGREVYDTNMEICRDYAKAYGITNKLIFETFDVKVRKLGGLETTTLSRDTDYANIDDACLDDLLN